MAGNTSPFSAPSGRPRAASGWFVWLGLTLLAGGLGAWASASAPSFYAELTHTIHSEIALAHYSV